MATCNVHEAKTHLSRLIDRAAAGEEIIIARAGKPVARLGPLTPALRPRRPGLLKGKIKMAKNFDAPLPAELESAFYRGDVDLP